MTRRASAKATQAKKSKWSMPIIVVVSTLLPLLVLVGIFFYFEYGRSLIEQAHMTHYLKNKYKQDFVVEKPKLSGSTIGISGVWNAIGYPKSNPTWRFSMQKGVSGTSDQYVATTWEKRETDRIQPDVQRIFAGIPVNVRIILSTQPPLQDTATLASPTYKEAIRKYPDYVTYNIQLNFDKTPGDTAAVAERAYSLIQLVKQGGVKNVYITYREKSMNKGRDMGTWCASRQSGSPGELEACFKDLSVTEKEVL